TSLKAAGAEKVFSEKISGAVTDRKALAKAISALGPGDILLVTRLALSPFDKRPAQHPTYGEQGRGQIPISRRCLGGYNHATWRINDYYPGWSGDLRASSDQGQDRRRPQASASQRCEIR